MLRYRSVCRGSPDAEKRSGSVGESCRSADASPVITFARAARCCACGSRSREAGRCGLDGDCHDRSALAKTRATCRHGSSASAISRYETDARNLWTRSVDGDRTTGSRMRASSCARSMSRSRNESCGTGLTSWHRSTTLRTGPRRQAAGDYASARWRRRRANPLAAAPKPAPGSRGAPHRSPDRDRNRAPSSVEHPACRSVLRRRDLREMARLTRVPLLDRPGPETIVP